VNHVLLWVLVALLGGCGAVLRLLVDEAVRGRAAGAFPAGIFVVNLTGALAAGVLAGAALSPDAALLATTAFVGSYSTFSTWMLDIVNAAGDRLNSVAVANLVLSAALGLAAAAAGIAIGGAF
jgi:CrcB protein